MAGVIPQGAGASIGTGQPLSKQRLQRLAFIQEDPDIALRFGQDQAVCECQPGTFRLTFLMHRQRLKDQDFNEAAHPVR